MAEEKEVVPILLGFIDGEIYGRDADDVTFKVSKIGGSPDWPEAGFSNPVCKGCSNTMVLVLQIYAPVLVSPDHRTLYCFACLTPTCWGAPHSWVCVRVQAPATPTPCTSLKAAATISATATSSNVSAGDKNYYFEMPTEWAGSSDEEDDDMNNANSLEATNINDNCRTSPNLLVKNSVPKTTTCNYIDDLQNIATTSVSENINLNKWNANTCDSQMELDATTLGIDLLNLNKSNGDVGAIGKATEEDEGASAMIEGAEGDMVAIDSPDQPSQDLLLYFKTPTQLSPTWTPPKSLCSYFIRVDCEELDDPKLSGKKGQELLVKYNQQIDSGKEDCGTDTQYVKGIPSHGDVYMHKFKKRISSAPDQIIRYCRDTGSDPLLLRPLVPIENKCRLCGSPLTFEAQIMPQLIPYLIPRLHNLNTERQPPLPTQNRRKNNKSSVDGGSQKDDDGCTSATNRSSASTNPNKQESCSNQQPIAEAVSIENTNLKSNNSTPSQSPRVKSKNHHQVKSKKSKDREDGGAERLRNAGVFSSPSSVPASGVVEYGTVLVFTCASSCWAGKAVLETVVVQKEVF